MPHPDEDEILDELKYALASDAFRKESDAVSSVLRHLVDRALAGRDISEVGIAEYSLKLENFDKTMDATVRRTAMRIRLALEQYNSQDGVGRTWRIDLPSRKWVPTFTRRAGPTPPPPPPQQRKKRKKLLIIAALLGGAIIAGLAVSLAPFFHESHCGDVGIAVDRPTTETVSMHEVIHGTKQPRRFWCPCKDYLVVEVAKDPNAGTRFNQGLITNSGTWSLRATFGDENTTDNTEFNVFVLSTTQNLKPNIIPSEMIGRQSTPIQVIRKR